MALVKAMITATAASTIASVPEITPVKYNTPTKTANKSLIALSKIPTLFLFILTAKIFNHNMLKSASLIQPQNHNDYECSNSKKIVH